MCHRSRLMQIYQFYCFKITIQTVLSKVLENWLVELVEEIATKSKNLQTINRMITANRQNQAPIIFEAIAWRQSFQNVWVEATVARLSARPTDLDINYKALYVL